MHQDLGLCLSFSVVNFRCFVLSNIGAKVINSEKGLICTVAYKMGKDSPTIYALESPLAMGGGTLDWLKDKMKMINDVSEVPQLKQ